MAGNAVLVQDYVAGRLSDSEREAFEERLLNDSGLVRDLEESLRLREGLEVLRERKILEQLRHPRRRGVFVGARWAAVAAAVVIVVSGAVYLGERYLGERSAPVVAASLGALRGGSSPALGVVGRYSFAAMREEASTPEIALPASGALELRALTAVTDASRAFDVTLSVMRDQKASQIGMAEHVVPDTEGFVVIYVDASRLEPGDYGLSVEPLGAGKEAAGERFAFRLRRAPR
jgi:hypothetical protein